MVRGLEAMYRERCRRGYLQMTRSRAVITGLARDLEDVLPASIARIRGLCDLFADARVVVFENDSRDRTRQILCDWAASDHRVTAICEDSHDPVNGDNRCARRAERMARYRARCHAEVLQRFRPYGSVIVVDFDAVGGWSTDGIANTFGHSGWDFVGSNGLIYRRSGWHANVVRHYDTWALRFDDGYRPIATAVAARYVYHRGEPLVPVTSCFGGVGIYSMEAFAAGRYEGGDDMEHVAFHRAMVAKGFSRLFLNPSQIVVHGRKRRSLDGCVRFMLKTLSAGRGEAWFYDDAVPAAVPAVRDPVPVPARRAA